MNHLIHDSIFDSAARTPDAEALVYGAQHCTYRTLAGQVTAMAALLLARGLQPGERVAVYMEKRIENVAAMFGASAAGCVFVPVNPLLKPDQVAYILADCSVRLLVTTPERLAQLAPVLAACPALQAVLVTEGALASTPAGTSGPQVLEWNALQAPPAGHLPHRRIDTDMAAILYTSGSTGAPKGVVLSHRNMVAGAASVADYLGMTASDRLLAVLPLSFDYGLSQLTTAFLRGASVVLMNYLFPKDIVAAVREHRITGLAAVPPLWIALARLAWPADTSLRFITNSGGAMPVVTVEALQQALPHTAIFLMYGLTEAFRSTYLPPSEVARRPGSIGRAIPNAEVLVVRPDGTLCDADEPGELVHRGALVALGYWNDTARTALRFRPAPGQDPALPLPEMAVWSGDTVRRDAEGFLYFVGRSDEMIKVSGYRISPTEVESVLHASGLVSEVAVFGVDDATLGQAIVAVAVADPGLVDRAALLAECKRRLPAYMVPAQIVLRTEALPRNPNGKIDRNLLRHTLQTG
ncbi:acyl-CoA ligase (AMP-forming), exosortase A system-associated [Massilia aurea]|uniref:acyl-CoA ligase (AMP-forming), exosortase A system-associated n=1 Tax=Massilia aurea TaxID=373040 RepID=UPI002162304A|nr:acyl-CoA ligase (AMP-forming), exosortase A system-associated [Massilia aurea]MCS0708707.1 acyl-CoA ligase (AMP-forming), exosortase A system-associated [Massilia aurea]